MKLHLVAAAALAFAGSCSGIQHIGPQAVNLWHLRKSNAANDFLNGGSSQVTLGHRNGHKFKEFPAQTFDQPLDHFSTQDWGTFKQRYWVNKRHYKPGGPVFVLDGGETSGEDRLPFLDTGIVDILAKATHGLGVVLEHRYYGESIPVKNFTTDSLRWLNNAQSLEDSAYFMSHVKFNGVEGDLTAPNTPWIYYGGSYAGARAAHMRVLYPDLVFGAIASSAVTHATIILWEYYEVIRLADPSCGKRIESTIRLVDHLLDQRAVRLPIKALFGLAELEDDTDFVSVLSSPLGMFQGKNWDPLVGGIGFSSFCMALEGKRGEDEGQGTMELLPGLPVDLTVFRYADWIKKNIVSLCTDGVEKCFGTNDDLKYQQTTLDQEWRLWLFQVCTEWGYFMTAPPDPDHPRIISKRTTLEYESKICRQAFPPGHEIEVPEMPDIDIVNNLGDFDIAADRLAFIDGQIDPWRPATPHSAYADDRDDTTIQPFKLIPGGVHHWDENGLEDHDEEPDFIQKVHREEVAFVKAWLKDFKSPA